MSFREMRNLCELTRALGYPHLVSMGSLQTANFELVADLLDWLCHRFNGDGFGYDVELNIETEQDRLRFLRQVGESMALKHGLKLNLKNLYRADRSAVRELLKLATPLAAAAAMPIDGADGDPAAETDNIADGATEGAFADVKATHSLAGDITRYGARLYERLAHQVAVKEAGQRALSRSLDMSDVQARLRAQAESLTAQVDDLDRLAANADRDEGALRQKLDKRRADLERHKTRLTSLESLRPAHADEYAKLEEQLSDRWDAYMKVRTLRRAWRGGRLGRRRRHWGRAVGGEHTGPLAWALSRHLVGRLGPSPAGTSLQACGTPRRPHPVPPPSRPRGAAACPGWARRRGGA